VQILLQGRGDGSPFAKTDSQTMEFNVELSAHGEKDVAYTW